MVKYPKKNHSLKIKLQAGLIASLNDLFEREIKML